MSTLYYQDSEKRQLRAERAAAMVLRNVYKDETKRKSLQPELLLAAVDLLTSDEILEKARDEMNRNGTY